MFAFHFIEGYSYERKRKTIILDKNSGDLMKQTIQAKSNDESEDSVFNKSPITKLLKSNRQKQWRLG